jgi:hypothetical protein
MFLLAQATGKCRLTQLNLEGNELGAEGAVLLAAALDSEHCNLVCRGDTILSTLYSPHHSSPLEP